MTKYGKLVDGNLEIAPRNKKLPNGSMVLNFDKNYQLLSELGYKEVIECPEPDYPYILSYVEQDDRIVEMKTRDVEAEQREIERHQREIAEKSLTKREVFLALYDDKGITPEQIRAQIADTRALIEFDYAERYYRGNPLITQLGLILGYTSEQLDNLFIYGSLNSPEMQLVENHEEPESTICFVCGNDPCTCNDEPNEELNGNEEDDELEEPEENNNEEEPTEPEVIENNEENGEENNEVVEENGTEEPEENGETEPEVETENNEETSNEESEDETTENE